MDKYKARLVAKWYKQLPGINHHDGFSPVTKLVTVRALLAIAIARNWQVHKLDINNAYLHGHIEKDLYMQAPAEYPVLGGQVCKFIKNLYGLKQAGR